MTGPSHGLSEEGEMLDRNKPVPPKSAFDVLRDYAEKCREDAKECTASSPERSAGLLLCAAIADKLRDKCPDPKKLSESERIELENRISVQVQWAIDEAMRNGLDFIRYLDTSRRLNLQSKS